MTELIKINIDQRLNCRSCKKEMYVIAYARFLKCNKILDDHYHAIIYCKYCDKEYIVCKNLNERFF
jgi:hypothetical protein